MNTQTETQKNRDIRTAYLAIDKIQALCDRGRGDCDTDAAFAIIRNIINKIENMPVRASFNSRSK